MIRRHRKTPRRPLPRLWLMTDERVPEAEMLRAVARLPGGAGVVFRHYSLPTSDRRALFEQVRRIALRRRLLLLLAGDARLAQAWRADGWHSRRAARPSRPMLHSAPAHDVAEMRQAEQAGAALLFLSPVFATRSHPGAKALGRVRFGLLARQARRAVIALGGLTAQRAKSLPAAHGWAGIDAFSGRSIER